MDTMDRVFYHPIDFTASRNFSFFSKENYNAFLSLISFLTFIIRVLYIITKYNLQRDRPNDSKQKPKYFYLSK